MILTCPSCDTKYVVKDGAIPPAGRRVRCAACKNAWHQDPEPVDNTHDDVMAASPEAAIDAGATSAEEIGGPPMPTDHVDPRVTDEIGEVPPAAADEALVSDYPEPAVEGARPGGAAIETAAPVGSASFAKPVASLSSGAPYGLTAPSLTVPVGEAPNTPAEPEIAEAIEPAVEPAGTEEGWADDHYFISSIDEEEARSGRGLKVALVLLILVALAAAAIWFLAPASFKEQIGLADASATPLEVMLTTSDRQKLASGNELLAISGRIINPTDAEQAIPPIRASLRNRATRKLVYQWTIAPPARSLPPRGSASFNSAEVDIPQGGDELTVTLGGAPS